MDLITIKDSEGDFVIFPMQNLISIEEDRKSNTSHIYILGREYPITVNMLSDEVLMDIYGQLNGVVFEPDFECD